MIGVALTLPDINQVMAKLNGRLLPFGWARFLLGKRKIDQCRVLALGVKKEYHHTGVAAGLYLKHLEEAAGAGGDHRRRDGLDPGDERADEPGDGGDGGRGREAVPAVRAGVVGNTGWDSPASAICCAGESHPVFPRTSANCGEC